MIIVGLLILLILLFILFFYNFRNTKEPFSIKPYTEAVRDLASAAQSVNEVVSIYVPNISWGYNFYDKFNDTIRAVRGLPAMKPVAPNINYTINDNIRRFTVGYSGFSV
jgi:hypothetical protein